MQAHARPLREPMKTLGFAVALIAGGLLILLGAAGADRAASMQSDFIPYCFGVLFLMAVVGIEVTRPNSKAAPAWLSPPALLAAWTLTWIYLPALAAFFDEDLLGDIAVAQGGYTLLSSGILLACVAVTALWCSYHAARRLLGNGAAAAVDRDRFAPLHRIVVLYAVSAGARALRVAVVGVAFGADFSSWGEFAAIDQWVGYLEDLRYLGLALLVTHVMRRGGAGRLWLLGALAIELVFASTSGFIKPFIWPVVVCVATAAAMDRIRVRHLATVAAAVVVIASFWNVVSVIRDDWQGGIGTSTNAGFGTTIDAGVRESQDSATALENAYRKFFGRQTEVATSTGLIVALTPTVLPFEGWQQFLMLPTKFVPRLLWPDKPILSRGRWFSVQYRGLDDDTTSSSAMTMFGEGFLFFGWTGVCVGMLIVGSVLAVLFRGLSPRGFLPVYLALLPTILEIEPELSSYVTSLVQRSLVFVIVFFVFTYRSRALRPVQRVER